MFLIAGVTPKTKILENTPRLCPICGLAQAYLERVDHYFSLFFVPVLRVKTGQPFLVCRRCDRPVDQIRQAYDVSKPSSTPMITCRACGRTLHKDFKYCPYCGNSI